MSSRSSPELRERQLADAWLPSAFPRGTAPSRCSGGCSRGRTCSRSLSPRSAVGFWGSGSGRRDRCSCSRRRSGSSWRSSRGLYDRDHRTMRHLTVDEMPWLLMWTLISTALLTLLLVPFPALDLSSGRPAARLGPVLALAFLFCAAVARASGGSVTPPQRVLVVGEGPLAQAFARKLELFPDIHADDSRPDRRAAPSCTDGSTGSSRTRSDRHRMQRAQRGPARRAPPVLPARGAAHDRSRRRAACSALRRISRTSRTCRCWTTTPGTSRGRRLRSSACST